MLRALRAAVVLGLLGFGLWSALPAIADLPLGEPFAAPTAQPAPASPAATSSAVAAVQAALARAQQGGGSVPVSLALTDDDLTRAAQPYFPQSYAGITVSDPAVRVVPGQVVLSATARTFLASGPLTAKATPTTANGRLVVLLDSVTLGGLALPDGLRAQVQQQLQSAIDAASGRLQVSSVTAATGVLTLKGAALP